MTRPGVRQVAPNRIDRPGTAEAAWDSWLGSRHLPVADLGTWSSAVIVAAHPDDEILGVRDIEVIRLRLPDTGLAACEDELTVILREQCAGFDICLAPWEADAHADHEAAGRAARRAGRDVLTYPIWMWHWAKPGDLRVPWHQARRVPLPADVAGRKTAAIGAFTSQLTGRAGAGGPVLPAPIVAHFTRRQEVLLR